MTVGFIALGIGTLTMCRGLFPGEPAETLSMIGGQGPLPSLTHPLWEGIVRLVGRWAADDFIQTLNAVSAITGAVATALLFHLGAIFRTGIASPRRGTPPIPDRASSELSGQPSRLELTLAHIPPLLAVLLGAGSFPFLFVATRSHPAPFDATMWLGALALIAAYSRTGRTGWLHIGSILLGLATVESPRTWILWPLILVWLLATMVRHRDLVLPFMPDENRGHLRIRVPVHAGALALFAIVLTLLIRAAFFQREPAALWAGADSFSKALLEVVRAQIRAARMAIPTLGWLVPALCIGLPGATVIAVLIGEQPGRRGPVVATLLLISAFSIAVALDAPLAPWPIFKVSPLYVFPYGVMAMWTAAASAGVIRLLLCDLDRRDLPAVLTRFELTPSRRRLAATVYAAIMTLALSIATGRHVIQVAYCDSTPFDEFARGVLSELNDADRIVLASPLEPLLTVYARRERPHLRVLNMHMWRHPVYLRYVAEVFADDARARGLAPVGLDAVLADWFARDLAVTGRVITVDVSDLWRLGGWTTCPGQWTYRGASAPTADEMRARWADFPAWTSQLTTVLVRLERLPPAFQFYAEWLRRHCCRLLNDFGFLLEELGLTAEALAAYEASATFDSNQYSARHNRARLTRQLGRSDADSAQAELDRWIRLRMPTFNPMEAARQGGRIRDPPLQVASSFEAARAGFLDLALSELTDLLLQQTNAPSIQLAMAAIFDTRGNAAESRALLQRLATQYPERPELQLTAGLAALNAGDITSAVAIARSVGRLDPPAAMFTTYEALLAAETGEVSIAVSRLNRRLAEAPDDLVARLAAGYLAAKSGDTAGLRRNIESLRSFNRRVPWLETMLAHLLAVEGRTIEARSRIEEIVARHPAFGPAWDVLLALDVAERREALAREHAARLLRFQPAHPRANHVWASLLMKDSKWAEAEAALEVAWRSAPNDAGILNDLAWCRLQLGQIDSALELATRAVELKPDSVVFLDSLARALLAVGQTNRAAEVVRRALALAPNNADVRELATSISSAASWPAASH